MKKIFSLILLLIFIISMLFLLTSCIRMPMEAFINRQKNVKWASDDGKLIICTNNYGEMYGIIDPDGLCKYFFLKCRYNYDCAVFEATPFYGENFSRSIITNSVGDSWPSPSWDRVTEHKYLGFWSYKYNWKGACDTIVITVKETTYFEEGQKIVLKRVAENISSEEISYPPVEVPEFYDTYEKYKDVLGVDVRITLEEIEQKYGEFDFCAKNYYYYFDEIDDDGKPKYVIKIEQVNHGCSIYLGTPQCFGLEDNPGYQKWHAPIPS